jgi:hypothetical protein
MYIKGTFAGSFECPFYAGLTVVKTSLVTSKPKGQNRLARFVYGNCILTLSVPDEGYSRNMSCTLNYIRNLRFIT